MFEPNVQLALARGMAAFPQLRMCQLIFNALSWTRNLPDSGDIYNVADETLRLALLSYTQEFYHV